MSAPESKVQPGDDMQSAAKQEFTEDSTHLASTVDLEAGFPDDGPFEEDYNMGQHSIPTPAKPLVYLEEPSTLVIWLISLLPPIFWQGTRWFLPIGGVFIISVIMIPAAVEARNRVPTAIKRPTRTPHGSWVLCLSVALWEIGAGFDMLLEETWKNCIYHFVLSFFLLFFCEQKRFFWNMRQELSTGGRIIFCP
ncbi:hypothetical protein DM02DRAFT_652131 [Periconia macrospinosa]|uniref:Uncharacterized protein n=1 Tax=Periconia macrospinosa TaxID=97972 RepID=A0A2V1E0S9_9PLEO|nr:hypothetical protein DM02DRAFT_652131 [Periconia macrospinosa]